MAAIIGVVYLVLTALSTVWTDYQWFDSVGYVSVWQVRIFTTVVLGAIGAAVVFLFVWANLIIADKISPRLALLQVGEDDEIIERFQDWVEPRLRLVRLGISAALALLIGIGVAAFRDDVLLYLNSAAFQATDPQFGNDIAFYLFRLPLWAKLTSWAFNLVALTTVLVAALHYLNGGIRVERGTRIDVRPGVKAHISGLIAVLALIRAVAYRIDVYELLYARQRSFAGAGYTDINARLPALNLLVLVSIVAAVLLIWNIWRRGWTLAVVSIGAWAFVSIAAGVIYPAVVQRFVVVPNELDRERPYIARNIEATREAFGLADVEIRPFAADFNLDAEDISNNRPTIDNLRLWDPKVLPFSYQNRQEIRTYYRVDRVDSDRYLIDGEMQQVMVAARELDEPNLPATDWLNQRLVYTHGFGAVVSPANDVEPDGQPALWVRDVPPRELKPELALDQSRIYFGESYQADKPVVVKTGSAPQEVDFPLEETTSQNEYDGADGVDIGGLVNRLAFSLRYRDLNMLISSQLRPDSRLIMERNIRDRVNAIAPFLAADSDPYPVIFDRRVVWVVDMYSYSSYYPYAQPVTAEETRRMAIRSGLDREGWNYIRNSVKATVDAFDGTVTLYVVDPDDPIVKTWRKVFPDIFKDFADMPEQLVEHLRYPQDMFRVQTEMYIDYHMTNTDEFFPRVDAWAIPKDPSTPRRADFLWGDRRSADLTGITYLDRILPYYVLLRLPGEEHLSYVLMQPYTPEEKPNMSSILVADSTPGTYGRLIDYRLPRGVIVEGTGQVGNRIEQDDEIAGQFTLWRGQGSNVILGDLLVLPVEESIIYVQPVYLESEQGGLPFAEFRRAVVVYGDRVEWAPSLDEAMALVFGDGTQAPIGPTDPPSEPPVDREVAQLLTEAAEAFNQANAALRAGDLAGYQRLVEEAQRLVEEALEKAGAAPQAQVSFIG